LEYETKLIEFQCFVGGLCQRNKHSLSEISNVDKSAVFLNMSHNYSINFKGGKQGTLDTTGHKC
jgi:hypothetical protein